MKKIHYITCRVYVKEQDDKDELAETLTAFLPENFEKKNIQLVDETVKIDETTTMSILRCKLEKQPHIKYVFSQLKDLLGPQQCTLLASQENRVDKKGHFFIRLEKEALLQEHKAVVTDTGNCFHFTIMLAAYPKTKENALAIVQELFFENKK